MRVPVSVAVMMMAVVILRRARDRLRPAEAEPEVPMRPGMVVAVDATPVAMCEGRADVVTLVAGDRKAGGW
jgi:hypothetical protein